MGVISFTKLQHSGETLAAASNEGSFGAIRDKERYTRVCAVLFTLAAALTIGCRSKPAPDQVGLEHLSVVLPSGWQQVPPSSSMRAVQAVVPGPGGDAELVVYYFGAGQGGDVESNLGRWMNQVIPTAGTAPHRETFESGDLRITWIDSEGTIKPGEMGMGPQNEQPNSRLLAAVVEGDHGPWFVKLTGPEATVTPQREAFLSFLRSAAPR